jgi:hypothetical protein
MVEKIYQSRADVLDVDPSLFKFSKQGENESINMLVHTVIDATREDIIRSLQARQFQLEQGMAEQPRRFLINRIVSRVPEERVMELQQRLLTLLQEFENENDASRHGSKLQPYALTVAFYPSFYFEAPKKEKKK